MIHQCWIRNREVLNVGLKNKTKQEQKQWQKTTLHPEKQDLFFVYLSIIYLFSSGRPNFCKLWPGLLSIVHWGEPQKSNLVCLESILRLPVIHPLTGNMLKYVPLPPWHTTVILLSPRFLQHVVFQMLPCVGTTYPPSRRDAGNCCRRIENFNTQMSV